MDRVHRLGQTRPVEVIRYVCENTIEKRILELQESKQALSAGLMRKLRPAELRKARAANLRSMFELDDDEGEGDGEAAGEEEGVMEV